MAVARDRLAVLVTQRHLALGVGLKLGRARRSGALSAMSCRMLVRVVERRRHQVGRLVAGDSRT